MSTPRHSFKLTIASTAIAAALPFAMTPGFISTAFAQVGETSPEATASPLIDFTRKGSIKIENAQEGVTYTVYKLKEYKKAADIPATKTTVAAATAAISSITGTQLTQDNSHKVSDLGLGEYFVKVEGSSTVHSFVVSVPSTNAARTGWDYDLSITTKDAATITTKRVVDNTGVEFSTTNNKYPNVGDNINYLITSPIPSSPYGSHTTGQTWLQSYQVTDNNIDDPNLSYQSVKVAVGTDLASATPLTAGDDYTNDAANKTVSFTTAGLIKLANQKANEQEGTPVKVFTTFTAKVNAVGATDGQVENTANVQWSLTSKETDEPDKDGGDGNGTTNNPNDPGTDGNPTPVTDQWVKIRATKVDNSTEPKKLAGAEFAVYKCTIDDNDTVDLSTITEANKLLSSAATTSTGEVVIDGINTKYGKVCLVETKAPSGFELQPKPTVVSLASPSTVTGDGVTNADGTDMKVSVSAGDIVNVPSKFPTLPLTGGKGVALFAFLAALIAGATVLATRKAARK